MLLPTLGPIYRYRDIKPKDLAPDFVAMKIHIMAQYIVAPQLGGKSTPFRSFVPQRALMRNESPKRAYRLRVTISSWLIFKGEV